ncbi:TolC family protein [Gemmatimonas sp.]|uniref:TolC family protein n=1 Tax=Gemmatimonas sp. TaxID=1962908 RepID=UPI0037BE4A1A
MMPRSRLRSTPLSSRGASRQRRMLAVLGAVLVAAPLSSPAQPQTPGQPTRVAAGDDDARPIRLAEAVQQAQRNAPAVVQARGVERNAAAAGRSALAAYLPNLTLNAGSARTQGVQFFQGALVPLRGDPWNYNNGLAANVQLFDGNQRWNEISRSRATADAADAAVVQARFDAALQTKQQFYAAVAARESEAAARAQLEQAEQQLKASTARVAAGVATKSDSLRSVIQVGNARLAVLTAQNDLRVANAALTRVIGSQVLVTPAADDTVDTVNELPSEQELTQLAGRSPVVMQAEANLMAARASKRAQRSSFLPSLTMSYNYAYTQTSKTFSGSDLWLFSGGNPNRQQLNFNVSYPLFNGLVREQQSVQTDVLLRNAEAQLRDARLAARQNLTTQLRTLNNAQARVQIQQAAVAASEEDLRVQQQRYALGASTLLDLLTSQTQLNQARQALIQARLDGRIARAQLSALVGREL